MTKQFLEEDDDLELVASTEEASKIHRYHTEVGRRMRSLRENRSLTLEDLAAELGIVSNYLGNLERAKKTPGVIRHFKRLAELLDTTTDYLLCAPWAKNSERNPSLAISDDAMRAARIIDTLPETMRRSMLVVMEQYAAVLTALMERERQLIRYRIGSVGEADLSDIRVGDTTLAEFLSDVFPDKSRD